MAAFIVTFPEAEGNRASPVGKNYFVVNDVADGAAAIAAIGGHLGTCTYVPVARELGTGEILIFSKRPNVIVPS